jgi:hypothetical protein
MEEIVNGMLLGNRFGVSVLVKGALGWAMFAGLVKVAKGGESRLKPKEMKKVILKGPFVPFVSLFATRV